MLNHFVNNFERLLTNLINKNSILIFRVRTQAAEVRIICASSDNLDESLPCLLYNNEDNDDTPENENLQNQLETCQSSLFSEINSLVCLDFFVSIV